MIDPTDGMLIANKVMDELDGRKGVFDGIDYDIKVEIWKAISDIIDDGIRNLQDVPSS